MATIGLVTQSARHEAATATKALLEGLGHTVTIIQQADVTASNLLPFDMVATTRIQNYETGYASAKTHVAAYHATGKPLLLGSSFVATYGGPSSDTFAIGLGLMESSTSLTPSGPTQYAPNPHPIMSAAGISVPNNVSVYASSGYMEVSPAGAATIGSVLTVNDSNAANTRTGLAVEKGMTKLGGGGQTPAKAAWFGWLYGAVAYGSHAAPIIRETINWLLSPSAVILGKVETDDGVPLERTVLAYVRATGRLAGSTVSKPDGTFEMPTPYSTDLHFVVAFDELSGEKNAIIKDRVLPYIG